MIQTEKICTGCGRSSLNPVSGQHVACCPDNNYVEMSNNKQSMKLYTEEQLTKYLLDEGIMELSDLANNLIPHIELPSDEEIEEKLNVAYGNGYEQGEMDFYKKMQVKGDKYVEGYSEGYKRALALVKWKIDNDLQGGNTNEQ